MTPPENYVKDGRKPIYMSPLPSGYVPRLAPLPHIFVGNENSPCQFIEGEQVCLQPKDKHSDNWKPLAS